MAEAPTSRTRPLHLASRLIIPSTPSLNGPTVTEQTEREDFDCSPSLFTPPPSSSRRHSSISYIHSGPNSPFQPSFRRESMDVFLKSPLSETHPTSSPFSPVGERSPGSLLSRNNSLGGRNVKDKRASNRASTPSLLGDPKLVDAMKHLKERPPVTVGEKHAELLQFIAQKESKCLELRSQLSMHEAELLQLKRKWELIVNRGFDKFPSSPIPPLNLSPPFVSPSSASVPHAASPQTASSPYFPLIPGAHAPVLEGIKEGVQGMSRLLAAGLESFAGKPIDPSYTSNQPAVSLHPPPLPLLLGSVSKSSKRPESQSSSSTAASTSTFASESAAATNTSTTSIRSSFSFDGSQASTRINVNEAEAEDEDNGEGQSNSTPSSSRSEQVLIVRDTGATPMMSPNPDFERKRRSKKLNETRGGAGSPVKKNAKNDQDLDPWLDDSWDELSPRTRREQNGQAGNKRSAAENSTTMVHSPKSPPSLPPMTIPGLATMNLAGPAAQQMTSWMGTVGKKLGEIRGSSTFTKGQKRASVLLSDMQNTFVSSLISPMPDSPSPPPSSDSATGKEKKLHVLVPHFAPSNTQSLLDEFDGELAGHTTPALVPSPSTSRSTGTKDPPCVLERKAGESKEALESDDDWNW